MSREAIQHVYRISGMTGSEKNVLFVLAIMHDETDGYSQMSVPQIAKHSCLNEATVRGCIDSLHEMERINISPTKSMKGHKYSFNNIKAKRDDKARLELMFADFWEQYPRKSNKPTAKRAYFAAKPTPETAAIINKDVAMRKVQVWTDMKYVQHPSTYLNNRVWEEELPKQLPPKNGGVVW